MRGHVFVIQGDVRQLRCDARLLPVFMRARPKERRWLHPSERELPHPAPPSGWRSGATRTFFYGAARGGPDLWVADIGLSRERDLAFALETVRQWLAHALDRLRTIGRRIPDRAAPLLAMHLVASGPKNAARSMGELVHRLLDVVEEFVRENECDVAIVARDREQYTALQAARRERRRESPLPSALEPIAEVLARHAREGHLCALTGAGISMGAGLPSWDELLEVLADRAELDDAQRERIWASNDPLVQAEALAEHFPSLDAFHEQVARQVDAPRIALTHGLLASMPVNEVVTLNYDTLFEAAACSAQKHFDVIPHGRKSTGPAWLLKLHGCRTRPRDIVLTRADYERFKEQRLAFAGIVQSLLITRHMMFVGFGMAEPNIRGIVEIVLSSVAYDESAQKRNLGTILTLENDAPDEPWHAAFEIVHVSPDDGAGDLAACARLLEILLDQVALDATDPYEYLLDPRFDGLLGERGRALREVAARFADEIRRIGADTPAGHRILKHLEAMGLGRSRNGHDPHGS